MKRSEWEKALSPDEAAELARIEARLKALATERNMERGLFARLRDRAVKKAEKAKP